MSGEPAAKRTRVADDEVVVCSSTAADENSLRDSDTQKALEEVDSFQNELDTLTEKASEEILKVEQKYNIMRRPFFGQRGVAIEKIEKFWLTAFVNHPQIYAILESEEQECLHFLTKVEVEEQEDIKSGYSIKFHFKENPFFTNELLVKEFNLENQGDPVSSATPIAWKSGKNLVELSKRRAKGRGALHLSFFSWFLDTSEPAADDIAEVIKDDMWPNPLQYYMGGVDDLENGVNDDSIVTIDDDDDDDDDDDVEEIEDLEEIEDDEEDDEVEDS